jgi:anti-sigma B factor antagonist
MSLEIKSREVTDVVVVDLTGKLTLGEATGDLRDTIRELMTKEYKKILLNLENLQYMDSAGLGELVGAYTTVKNAGGTLKMLKVQGRALGLMEVTKLMTLFEFYDDEADAVKSFG